MQTFVLHPGLARLPARLAPEQPATALAPMQDVTDLPFMAVIGECGAPDWFFTEFFRVTATSRLEPHILRSITENPTGRPVFAQLIGEDLPAMGRTVRELLQHPVAGIDLNLGCPAPKVYKKNVGGGLLRDPARVDEIIGALRQMIPTRFTVKMRIGFDDAAHFDRLLASVQKHGVDLLSLHGRTVKDLYRAEVRYEFMAAASARLACPVLGNGNITSAAKAVRVVGQTGVAGVMIGRSAIRNPWIFRQIRAQFAGETPAPVALRDVRWYADRLWQVTAAPGVPERARVGKMKKYLNFVAQGVDPQGAFLAEMRRAETAAALFAVCDRHLLAADDGRWFADEPYSGVIARPNCETASTDAACSLDAVTA